MRRFYRVCITVILFGCSCNESDTKKPSENNGTAGEPNAFLVKDIPKNKNGNLAYLYKECQAVAKQIGIDTLTNGFDSLRIRFWFFAGMNPDIQILDISFASDKWKGVFIDQPVDQKTLKADIQTRKKSPTSSWDSYINKIITKAVLDLPDEDSIKGWQGGGGDLGIVCVEIAKKNLYRFYTYIDYPTPVKLPQFLSFFEIVGLTENEFKFKRVSKTR